MIAAGLIWPCCTGGLISFGLGAAGWRDGLKGFGQTTANYRTYLSSVHLVTGVSRGNSKTLKGCLFGANG